MLEIDPRLHSELRAKYERIEAESPPQTLMAFDPAAKRPHRRTLNLFAAAAGFAVVAAGIAVLAIGLNGHRGTGSPAPGGQSAATPTVVATPAILPPLPSDSLRRKVVLIPETFGTGTRTFAAVTVGKNDVLGLQYGCLSNAPAASPSIVMAGAAVPVPPSATPLVFGLTGCSSPDGNSEEVDVAPGSRGGSLTIRFNAAASVRWVIRVYEFPSGAVSSPTASSTVPNAPAPTPFIDGGAPAGATVLIPVMYGTGPMTLPSFTVASNVTLYVEEGCLSTSASDSMLTVTFAGSAEYGDGDSATGGCYSEGGGSSGSAVDIGTGGHETVAVKAGPSEKWVVLVYEGNLGP
jgi:hypothetical protein